MSYGNVYIKADIRKLKKRGWTKTQIVDVLGAKINDRYSDISITRGKRIVKKLYEGKNTTFKDWAR